MKDPKYPKTCAMVISREELYFIAEADDGTRIRLNIGDRTGYGHHNNIQPGLRIKVYQRPGEGSSKLRFVGS